MASDQPVAVVFHRDSLISLSGRHHDTQEKHDQHTPEKLLGALLGVAALALVAGCGSPRGTTDAAPGGSGFTPPEVPMQQSLGKMEGTVNILAWPGYAEDGSNDKNVNWVTPFEQQTGCQANVKYFATSDEAVSLMKTGDYDVVSASGDASLRLIASGDVAPVNTSPDQNYSQIQPFLKDSRGTASTARCTACPTAGAPTC